MSDYSSGPEHSQSAKPPPWNDPVIRSIAFQVLAVVLIGYFVWAILDNTFSNMARRGITTGFGFLNNEAGFDILMSLIDYSGDDSYGRTFVVGLLNTILVAVIGIFFATIIGFFIGIARLSNNWVIAKIATIYIEVIRNIPLLLQMFFWYIAVLQALPSVRQSIKFGDSFYINNRGLYFPKPVFEDGFIFVTGAIVIAIIVIVMLKRWAAKRQAATGQQFPVFYTSLAIIIVFPFLVFTVMGFPLSWETAVPGRFGFRGGTNIIPEFLALLWSLTMYTAAFIAEIVRSGIRSVSHGQTEAARALGISNGPTLRLVIIPQAMRVIIPPLTSQYLNLTKNSSLATAIGYPDLVAVFMGTTLNQTGQAVEIVAMTMAVYLAISLSISGVMNWYNKKMALVER